MARVFPPSEPYDIGATQDDFDGGPVVQSMVIVGSPGVGKSTLMRTVLAAVPPGTELIGMLSGEIRVQGKRQGFTVQAIGGEVGLLASPELSGEPRFGALLPDGRRRLGLSLRHLDEKVCPAIEAGISTARIAIIDEVGAMQAQSIRFRTMIGALLESELFLIATCGTESRGWLQSFRESPSLAEILITARNRDVMGELISCYVRKALLG